VVCLQEIKARPDQVPERCKLTDYHAYWHGERGYSGVSLHVRKALFDTEPAFTHPAFDMETRIVAASFGNLTIASVYVPNGGKDYPAKIGFFSALCEWAATLRAQGRDLVICGDLNIARADIDVHPKERKPGIIGQRPEERALFERMLATGMVDVGRALAPDDDHMFSWWPPWRNMRQRNIGWRIDYILAATAVADRATSCIVLADVGTSDHAPVMLTLA
jgi:exodeoxyribonuclease-3